MSVRLSFPWTLVVMGHLLMASPTNVRADELVLMGPHPFLKENALSVQYLMGAGLGQTFGGRGIGVGYGYMLDGPLWLDLQMNIRAAACSPVGVCGPRNSNSVDLLAGATWRMRTDVPLVPYLRGGGGLVFLYPEGSERAIGLAVRAGVGARYYIFDWLGLGVEAALSIAHGYFAQGYTGDRTFALVDLALGMEWQFR